MNPLTGEERPSPPEAPSRAATALIILAAAVFGGGSIGWGLGNPTGFSSLHPDEGFCLRGGMDLLRGADLQENYFYWGGMGQFTVSSAIVAVFRVAGFPFEEIDREMGWLSLRFGRAFSLATGILAALLLRAAGRLWFSERAGVFGALLFAVSPAFVESAGAFRPDMPAALGAALALYGCARGRREGGRRAAVWAGAGTGIAAAFRLPSGVIALAASLPLLAARGRRGDGGRGVWAVSAIFAAAALGGFAVLSPASFLHPEKALALLSGIRRVTDQAHADVLVASPLHGLLLYAGPVASFGFGAPLIALGYAGLAAGLLRRAPGSATFAVGAVSLLATLLGLRYVAVRYVLPLGLLAAAPAAALVLGGAPGRWRRAAALLLFAWTAAEGANRAYLRLLPDTRNLAAAWMREALPPETRLGLAALASVWFAPQPSVEAFPETRYYTADSLRRKGPSLFTEAGREAWAINPHDWRVGARAGHPFPEAARYVEGLRAGRTPDGLRWRFAAEFGHRPLFPFNRRREDEPLDFLFVSPGIEAYRRETVNPRR